MIDLTEIDPSKDDYKLYNFFEAETESKENDEEDEDISENEILDEEFFGEEFPIDFEAFKNTEIGKLITEEIEKVDTYMKGLRVLFSVIIPSEADELMISQDELYKIGIEINQMMAENVDKYLSVEEADYEYAVEMFAEELEKAIQVLVNKYFPHCSCDAYRINDETMSIAAQVVEVLTEKKDLIIIYNNKSIKIVDKINDKK